MNWIRENKFLTGFIAVMVIGAGVLGYLLYGAYSDYADVNTQFTAAAGDLKTLETRVPYPNQQNLTKYRAERDDLINSTHSLAENLSKMVLPVVDMSSSAFQDKLRDTIAAVAAKASQAQVKMPENASNKGAPFPMDFDQYQSQPPAKDAAGPLGRQLDAMTIVMNMLLEEHIDTLVGMTRTRLPQEGGAAAAAAAAHNNAPGGNKPGGASLVEKVPFDVHFIASPQTFQRILNDVAASDKQFFITRTLVVQNTDPKPASKIVDATAGGGGAPAAPAEANGAPATSGTDAASNLRFLVGTEQVDVAMRIEMVTFNPPDKAAGNAAPKPGAAQPNH